MKGEYKTLSEELSKLTSIAVDKEVQAEREKIVKDLKGDVSVIEQLKTALP